MPCTTCGGTGFLKAVSRCDNCSGLGSETDTVTKTITIPPCVNNGQILNVAGGNFHRGGYTDKARIKVIITPDPELRRDGANIISVVSLSLLEALKGTTKTVKTINGEKPLKIPGPRKHGDQITAHGFGASPRGAHIFIMDVSYPNDIGALTQFLEDGYIE